MIRINGVLNAGNYRQVFIDHIIKTFDWPHQSIENVVEHHSGMTIFYNNKHNLLPSSFLRDLGPNDFKLGWFPQGIMRKKHAIMLICMKLLLMTEP